MFNIGFYPPPQLDEEKSFLIIDNSTSQDDSKYISPIPNAPPILSKKILGVLVPDDFKVIWNPYDAHDYYYKRRNTPEY